MIFSVCDKGKNPVAEAMKVDWDEAVPQDVLDVWQRWRDELRLLSSLVATSRLELEDALFSYMDSAMLQRRPSQQLSTFVLWVRFMCH